MMEGFHQSVRFLFERVMEGSNMEVNTQVSSGFYTAHQSTATASKREAFSMQSRVEDGTSTQQNYYNSTATETRTTRECYLEMSAYGVNRALLSVRQPDQFKPIGVGFLFVGDMGYGMSASQVMNSESDDTVIRVKISLGQNNYETYDINLSEIDPGNATAIEMFAFCQYADANGTGVNNTFGSWHALKSFIAPAGELLSFSSLEEATTQKVNWSRALSKSTLILEEESTGETLNASDLLKMIKETLIEAYKQKNEKLSNQDDWREMSDEQWDKLLEGIDKYIEYFKEELEKRKELQEEAAMKGAANAPADQKASAASEAALIAAANGIAGEADEGADYLEKLSWTYDLQTEDQTVRATAKMANAFASSILSKTQELILTGDTTAGISETEGIKECATPKEDENKKKTWIITAFTEQGIICNESADGVMKELWRIDYKNPDDYKKVWDFLGKFDKDADLKFSGEKSFWEDFLSDKIDVEEVFREYGVL